MAQMKASESGVRVRMYNPGFGDCFLLAFPRKGDPDKPVYVMIDCGVHGAYKGGSDRIREVIHNIREATDGHIDLLVITHEHADHVSGFLLGKSIFEGSDEPDAKKIEVDEIWFGWTEEPGNERAERLDKTKKLLLQGLRAAATALKAAGEKEDHSMLGFYDFSDAETPDGQPALGLDNLGVSTRGSRDQIRKHARSSKYLRPKQKPLEIPGVEQVRVFVLGPPEDEAALLSPDPTGEEGEVYEGDHHMKMRSDEALVAAFGSAERIPVSLADPSDAERYQPFTGNHRRHVEKVKARPKLPPHDFFHEHYGFADRHEAAWRRIDDEWLQGGEALALKLDSATNNTSLVLAIELRNTERVLLFPGDAQVGNWKSWHKGGWSKKNGLEGDETISAEELLNRTVLYKVGHHGSHNATLQNQGLKMMTSPDLIALIPVDQKWAEARRPHAWKMPFGPLYEDLQKRTRGRIVRTDKGVVQAGEAGVKEAWKRFPGKAPATVKRPDRDMILFNELEIPDR